MNPVVEEMIDAAQVDVEKHPEPHAEVANDKEVKLKRSNKKRKIKKVKVSISC